MEITKKVELFGDSLLKGIQVNPLNKRYHVNNNINFTAIEETHALSIKNFSKFGCTITKGITMIDKRLQRDDTFCDAIVMDFGGNDCDFKWHEIAERPDEEHLPNTPTDVFINTYYDIISLLQSKGIRPVLTTLPPLDAQRFFDWFCSGINKDNVLKWLESVETIYRWQESYSRAVEKIAADTGCLLVDIRGAFLKHTRIKRFLCEDGTHPNTEGQKIITQAFLDFIDQSKAKGIILSQ